MTEHSVPGYESYFKNRLHKEGDGVICYVKNSFPVIRIEKQDSDKYDFVYIELETSKRNKLTTGTVYRPPKQQAPRDAALYEEIHTKTQEKQSVNFGDFYCRKINWNTMNGDQKYNRLLEMLGDTFMTQIIT